MFSPKGKKFGDFDIIEKDGKLYCLFIEKPKPRTEIGNDYGLAESDDGINWHYLGTVMETGTGWDNKSLWALKIFKGDKKEENESIENYYLFYSAISYGRKDHHLTQAIGMAQSIDLKNWEKLGAIISPNDTKNHYYPKEVHRFCWRDPHIFKIKDGYYCIFGAKDINQPFQYSGCVAIAKSKDLKDWKVLPPFFSPGKYWEIESPHLYRIKKKWVLIFGTYKNDYSMSYATGSSLRKLNEPETNIFTPSECYAGIIFKRKRKHYFYHWIRDRIIGKHATYLAPPKLVELKDERLLLKKAPQVDQYFDKRISKKFKGKARITITASRRYSRSIYINNTKFGLAVRVFSKDNEHQEVRTIPLNKPTGHLEVFIKDKLMEVYLDDYFIYATLMEEKASKIKRVTCR